MLLLVEKILPFVPFNGAFSGTTSQVDAPIFVPKMVTRASMMQILLADDLPQNMRQHLSPPGPVVIHVRAPQIQSVRNSF